MRILVSGAFGFVGSSLVSSLLSANHEVVPLVRSLERQASGIYWDPQFRIFKVHLFEHFDACIHLAGESLATGRWTEKKKQKIYQSRVRDTSLLCDIFSKLKFPPKIFIVASAVGYYGDRKDELLTEKSEPGQGFLASVALNWEKASSCLSQQGIRVVQMRFGIVLSRTGGFLSEILPIYHWGLGGKIGTGQQWMSWISLCDLTRAMIHVLNEASLVGPINAVSPKPLRQQEFARELAGFLKRPCFLSLPEWILVLFLGKTKVHELLLASNRVVPHKLLSSGFVFQDSSFSQFLKNSIN